MLSIFEMAQRKFHPTQENQHQMKKEREKDIRSKKKTSPFLKVVRLFKHWDRVMANGFRHDQMINRTDRLNELRA